MNVMKQWMDIVKNLTMLTQFGLTLITPTLLCLGLCWLLYVKAGLGGWVFFPGFFFGLGGSAMVAWKLYVAETRKGRKESEGKNISFNRHE